MPDPIYGSHPAETLERWARRLQMFRFCRAHGGHANDGDELRACLRYATEAELTAILDVLQVPVAYLPPDRPRPVPGKHYSLDEYEEFEPTIEPFLIKQPGRSVVAEQKVFIWGGKGILGLHIADPDNPYEVSEACVDSAARIEPLLARLANTLIEPPLDDPRCLCPKYYPEFWTGQARGET